MDRVWLSRKPQNKLDRFALQYVEWRGLHPIDHRGAPWVTDPSKEIWTGPVWPVMVALKSAWMNTWHWKPK